MTLTTSRCWLLVGGVVLVPVLIVIGLFAGPILALAWLRAEVQKAWGSL